jgi:hypothetical protein
MCLIWRQHRGQALWVGLTLASICALALGVSWSASHWLAGYHQWVKALADAGCPPPDAHSGDFHVRSAATCNTLRGLYSGAQQPAFVARYNFTVLVFEDGFPAALAIIGVLVGAPLVAREVEQRTQLASWTQSVSRRRWYVMKVTVLAASLAAVGLAAGIANARLQRSLGSGGLISSRWVWFFSTNLALVGEILLAFALGVAFGAWLRRTLAAAGAGIASFLVLLFATGWAVRTLTPTEQTIGPTFTVPAGGWGLSQSSSLRSVPYHPASQYWPLQLVFLAVLGIIVVGVLATGWHATRTRAV